MTLVLSPATEARLREGAEQIGQDVDAYAEALLLDGLAGTPAFSAGEMAAIDAAIAAGSADFASGRYKSLEDVIADKMARFGVGL